MIFAKQLPKAFSLSPTRSFFRRLHDLSEISQKIRALDESDRRLVHDMLRVNQAGELGAYRIYQGQMAVLSNTKHKSLLQVGFCSSAFCKSFPH